MVTLPNIEGLGTRWWFELFDCPEEQAVEIEKLLHDTITTFNNDYSRFNDGSYVGRLNNGFAIIKPPAELLELLKIAEEWHQKTKGLFTIGSGQVLEERGYGKKTIINSSESDTRIEVYFDKEIVELKLGKIDFGGFGKGFLIDKLANVLRENNINEFLINGGGDMYASEHNGKPIEVHIEHPTEAGTYIAKIPLMNTGLGVSSSYKRQWKHQVTGQEHNHFVHPKKVDEVIKSSSHIVAPTALQADIVATMTAIEPEMRQTLSNEMSEYLILSKQNYLSPNFKNWLLK